MTQEDKINNFCMSCFNKGYINNELICGLKDSYPKFDEDCANHRFDLRSLEQKKGTVIQNIEVGKENDNDDSKCISVFEGPIIWNPKQISEEIIFEQSFIFQLIFYLFFGGVFMALSIGVIIFFQIEYIILVGLLLLLFYILNRNFRRPGKIIINKNGITIGKMTFFWRFIDDIYFKYLDIYEGQDEYYLYILLKSGEYYEFDITKVSFSEKKLIYYLNYFKKNFG